MSEQDVIDEIGAELSAGNFEKALKLSQAAELEDIPLGIRNTVRAFAIAG